MTHKPDHFTVWAELPVTDLDRATTFYNKVFETELQRDDNGPNPMAVFPTADGQGSAGHLYPGTPAKEGNGPTIHLAVPGKLEDAMARVTEAGGKVLSDPITIPVGRFAYAIDLDGNSIGLFETAA